MGVRGGGEGTAMGWPDGKRLAAVCLLRTASSKSMSLRPGDHHQEE